MTPDDAKKLLPIIQAFAEGKQIQYRGMRGWGDVINPGFTELPHDYRIKPEKKVMWVNVYENAIGITFAATHSSKESANEGLKSRLDGSRRIACIKVEYEEGEGL